MPRRRRVAMLHALLETTTLRFANVGRYAAEAIRPDAPPKPAAPGTAPAKPGDTALFAMVLDEHARTQLGRPRASVAVVMTWLRDASSPTVQRQATYWVARTLLARREYMQAYSVASAAWSAPGALGNAELRWRLATVAGLAARTLAVSPDSASMHAHATTDRQTLEAAWPDRGARYFARPDFTVLRLTSSPR